MKLVFEQIDLGNAGKNFGYIIGDRDAKECVLIDPAFTPAVLVERAKVQGLKITHILNTHEHRDHINGNAKAREASQAPVAAWKTSAVNPHIKLTEESVIKVGSFSLEVCHTPGHSPDHVTFYEPQNSILISGDLLFVGKIGGVGCRSDAFTIMKSLEKIQEKYPAHASVWPGHNYGCRPSSTLGIEKASNPFLRFDSFAEFMGIIEDWGKIKEENGLI